MGLNLVPPLPTEIWLEIASYLPRSECQRLLGLHRVFFETEMNYRYHSAKLLACDPPTLKLLSQLSYPGVGRRVQHLHVEPILYHDLDPSAIRPSLTSSLQTYLRKILLRDKTLAPTTKECIPGFMEYLRMLQAISSLPNVTRVSIHFHQSVSREAFMPVVTSIRPLLGSNLRCLCLDATLERYPSLLRLLRGLQLLDEIQLTLCQSSRANAAYSFSQADIDGFFRTVLAPWIAGLYNLRLITLVTIGTFDISQLFSFLSHLRLRQSSLEGLTLAIPFDSPHLSDISKLVEFTLGHRQSLKRLAILPKAAFSTPVDDISHNVKEFLLQLMQFPNTPILPKLNSLDIQMGSTESLQNLSEFLLRLSPGISILSVRDRVDCDQFINALKSLSAFAGSIHLTSLRLGVNRVTAELFNALAEALPKLRFLDLTLHDSYVSNGIRNVEWTKTFAKTMKISKDWSLRHVRIAHFRRRDGQNIPHRKAMQIVADRIPSVEGICDEMDCCPHF